MDLGATICTPRKPLCLYCPMQQHCQAYQQGLEHELPFKKARKPVPVKTAEVLVLQCGNEWLWQQRESHGLWGGLYCLPILEQATELQQIEQHFNLQAQVSSLQISHSFTHFTWILHEKLFHVEHDQKEQLGIEINGIWLKPEDAVAKGIPTAMKKFITAKQKN